MFRKTIRDQIGIKEVMNILGCSRSTVYNYIKKNRIATHKTGLGRTVYSRSQIEALKEVVK